MLMPEHKKNSTPSFIERSASERCSFPKALYGYFLRTERLVGGLKFAVVVITLLALGMIAGTLLESYYGTDFANRVIYKNWPFITLQFLMFLSILFAAFLRLPPRKRLYGFYTIHGGLILLGSGSLVTYLSGIDGQLHLPPLVPSREVVLDDDVLLVTLPDEGRQVKYLLPYKAFPTQLEAEYSSLNMTLLSYLPYSESVLSFKDASLANDTVLPLERHSSHYKLQNDNISQDFWLSLHPQAKSFSSSLTLGPLSIHYLPSSLADCLSHPSKSQMVLWNRSKGECFTLEKEGIPVKKTKSGRNFVIFKEGTKLYRFFPDLGPWPVDKSLQVIHNTEWRIFSKSLFTKRPHLFLFGDRAAYYLKDDKRWEVKTILPGSAIDLPWMGFELSLLQYEAERVPRFIPRFVLPLQVDGKLVRGGQKAVHLRIGTQDVWVSDNRPVRLVADGRQIHLALTKDSIILPFEFVLDRFKMEKDPGTSRPASFESFVRVFHDSGPREHHIFMNNPLKQSGLTFYQASYSQDEEGTYSSTLSVNMDPGRPIKYSGSLFLVLGAVAHYALNRRKKYVPRNRRAAGEGSGEAELILQKKGIPSLQS